MVINQGELYWVDFDEPIGSEPGYRHPHVVIQNNACNHSRLNTVLLCELTSNLKRATIPGNVLLNEKEAGLPKQSVVAVTRIVTVDKSQLGAYIGTLSSKRVRQILDGIRHVTEPRELEKPH
ncbi:MAG: type II toxin-antitoxin system PemK/MazF family toxin [Acidobacteriota bacterium]|nr:type II toxin-antitoxin system PemK/MazF family toxin [Acidobacteriota bacterium]